MFRECRLIPILVVCLFSGLAISAVSGQSATVTEGSLRVLGVDAKKPQLCPLKSTRVSAEVRGFVSRVTVTQNFQNPFDRAIEAVYRFPLPNDAAVDDMTIKIGERTIKGKIMERQKARETYDKAKQEGKVAALLDQERPNIFTQSVANITPNAEIQVVIEYVETLKYRDDAYEFTFPMTIGERYIPASVNPSDAARISPRSKRRPGHTISLDLKIDAGFPIQEIYSRSHLISTQQLSPTEYRVSLAQDDEIPNRDFVVKYKTAGAKIEDAILTSKDERGGFFTLILQPPDKVMPQDTTPKEIVFVLDTSGSMEGFPVKKAKEAMNLTLDNLNPDDRFNLITFAGETKVLFEKPVPPTPENMALARKMLNESESYGGTEMMQAIKAALAPSGAEGHVRVVCFMTDGQVGNEYEIISEVQKNPNARVFAFGIGESVNHFLLDEISREGRGEVEYVGLDDDGSAAAKRFYERIRNPLLTDISLEFDGVQVDDVLPKSIPDLFDSTPVNVVGRYAKGGKGKIVLNGKMNGQSFRREISIELPTITQESDVLPTLWARRKVAALMRKDYTGLQANQFQGDLQATVTDLGLQFRLLTPFTSFVAVDENVVTDGSSTPQIDVPVAAPMNGQSAPGYTPGPPVNAQNYPPNPPGVGGVSEVVVVTSGSEVSETSSTTGTVVESQVLSNMPLNGRSVQSLVLLTPGVNGARVSSTSEQQSVGGQPAGMQYSVDGVSSNLGVQADSGSLSKNIGSLPTLTASGGTNSSLAADSIQEITVSTSALDVGRTSGVRVDLVTRSGTNSFHGNFFETLGNEVLNANDYFANSSQLERAPARLNQFGAAVGGYVVKDRAFFFSSYEGLRLRKPAVTSSEVPGQGSRNDASPIMRPILNAFPMPNGSTTSNGFAEFAASYTNPADHDVFSFRFDGVINDNLRVTGTYNFANSGAKVRASDGLSVNTIRHFDTRTDRFAAKASYTATPSLLISGGVNYSRNHLSQTFTMDGFGGAILDPSIVGNPFSMLRIDMPGQNAAFAIADPITTDIEQVEPAAQIDWVHENHTFKFGAEVRRLSSAIGSQPHERVATFSGVAVGGVADRVNEVHRATGPAWATTEISAYAMDQWRITPKVQLNLGVRWEADIAPDLASSFTLGSASTEMPNSFRNFSPRVGLAYEIFSGHSIIRVGGGLYYDHGLSAMSESFANSYPTAVGQYARSATYTSENLNRFIPSILFEDGLRTPRSWQVYGEFQQELFNTITVTGAYQGLFGRELYQTRTFVDGVADPQYARQIDNSASSNRHEGRLSVNRRFSSGLAFSGRYTFAQSTDNKFSDSFGKSFSSSIESDPQKAASDFDVRHDLSFWGTYTIPRLLKSGWKKSLTEGWTVSGFVNARTGFPINVTYARVGDLFNEFFRPDVVPHVPLFINVDGIRALNPEAFQIPAAGGQGSLSRNSLRGFPFFQINASIARRFRLASESNLEFRVEAINLLNNTNFADSDGSLGTVYAGSGFVPNHHFGQSMGTYGGRTFTPFYLYGGPRSLQLSAKFSF